MAHVALVTGASAGIGAAIARDLAARGTDLILTARREDRLQGLANDLRTSVEVSVIAADLASHAGVDALLSQLADRRIDILVNNAGQGSTGGFLESTAEATRSMIELNVQSVTALTHALLPGMLTRGGGRILNIASVAAFQPVPDFAAYAASKAFVLSLTESLSEELRGTGVSVTALCPGITRTDMTRDLTTRPELPAGLVAEPAEVARAGVQSMLDGEVIAIPGVANQAAVAWAQHQPRWLVRGLGGLVARFTRQVR